MESAKTYLEIQEVEQLEKAATNLRDRLLIRLLFHLGCRISEALTITVEDIDPVHSTVRILHLKIRINLSCTNCNGKLAKHNIYCPRCGQKVLERIAKEVEHHRRRILPIDRETLKILKEYIARGGPIIRDGKRLIFGINRHRAWQIITDCAENAGLPKTINQETGKTHNISPHRLRDAFVIHAVKLDDSGDGLRFLQEHLGHQSFNTTARYRKISSKEHEEWYRKLWENNRGSAT